MDFFLNPTYQHAMLVHFPVALALVGIPLVYFASVIHSYQNQMRWIAAVTYLILALTAWLAMETGERAMGKIPADWSQAVWDRVETHENMGHQVWIFGLVTAVLLVFSTVRFHSVRSLMAVLAILASIATGGWVAVTGHYGGTLVYLYGAGTPAMHVGGAQAAIQAGPPPAQATTAPGIPLAAPVASMVTQPAQPAVAPDENLVVDIRPFTPDEAKLVQYRKDVVPILESHCTECHKPDKMKGDLDLTSIEKMLEGGKKAGPAIIPGKPDESPLVEYIRGLKRPRMPKGRAPMSAEELHVIRKWIAAGATGDAAASAAAIAAPAPAPAGPQAAVPPAPAGPATPAAPAQPAPAAPPAGAPA